MTEPAAQAKVFGTAVILAAAGRSSGATTAMTYEARVGTSICDSALRASNRATAVARSGAKGMRIRNRFEGRCVNTIVLMSPMRLAIGTATKYEIAEQTPLQNRIAAAVVTEIWKLWYSHSASSDCTRNPVPNESMPNKAARP